ncbi:MAG: sulfatase, partial [bacterium]
MRQILTCFLFFAFSSSFISRGFCQQKNGKPNIIFFMVDDMGWQDCSLPFWDKATP